jgi:hypothetical protein
MCLLACHRRVCIGHVPYDTACLVRGRASVETCTDAVVHSSRASSKLGRLMSDSATGQSALLRL